MNFNTTLRGAAAAVLSTFALLLGPTAAEATVKPVQAVDVELSLLVDVSGSINSTEFKQQKQAYENVFRDPAIISKLTGGPTGLAAVNFMYWSGASQQMEAVGWTLISDAASSNSFANAIGATTRPYSGLTAIGEALLQGGISISNNGFDGARKIIDISGDGINNNGTASNIARDKLLNKNIVDTINGIVITSSNSVLNHYQTQVIGGDNAFAMQANSFADFEKALHKKLMTELTPVPEPSTYLMMASFLALLALAKRRKEAAQTA
jgi:hypothetical protein